jgi:hypothetical protein
MRLIRVVLTVSMVLIISAGLTIATGQKVKSHRILIQNGQLLINGKAVRKGFSLSQDDFHFLYFYVPDQGLFLVSSMPFEGGTQSGAFEGQDLEFRAGNLTVTLKSSSPILGSDNIPAWVKYDPNVKLDTRAVIFGYGDEKADAYTWTNQVRKASRQ